MAYAKRGNKLIQITESNIQQYLNQGYDIVDELGAVVRESVPNDLTNLKISFAQQRDLIIRLRAENGDLKAQVTKLQEELNEALKAPVPATKRSRKNPDSAE